MKYIRKCVLLVFSGLFVLALPRSTKACCWPNPDRNASPPYICTPWPCPEFPQRHEDPPPPPKSPGIYSVTYTDRCMGWVRTEINLAPGQKAIIRWAGGKVRTLPGSGWVGPGGYIGLPVGNSVSWMPGATTGALCVKDGRGNKGCFPSDTYEYSVDVPGPLSLVVNDEAYLATPGRAGCKDNEGSFELTIEIR